MTLITHSISALTLSIPIISIPLCTISLYFPVRDSFARNTFPLYVTLSGVSHLCVPITLAKGIVISGRNTIILPFSSKIYTSFLHLSACFERRTHHKIQLLVSLFLHNLSKKYALIFAPLLQLTYILRINNLSFHLDLPVSILSSKFSHLSLSNVCLFHAPKPKIKRAL